MASTFNNNVLISELSKYPNIDLVGTTSITTLIFGEPQQQVSGPCTAILVWTSAIITYYPFVFFPVGPANEWDEGAIIQLIGPLATEKSVAIAVSEHGTLNIKNWPADGGLGPVDPPKLGRIFELQEDGLTEEFQEEVAKKAGKSSWKGYIYSKISQITGEPLSADLEEA